MSRTMIGCPADPARSAPASAPRRPPRSPSASERPARGVEARCPADLDVADAVGGLGLDELGRDPDSSASRSWRRRIGRSNAAQELGLRGPVGGRDERGPHRGLVPWRVHVPRPREVERGRRRGATRRGGGGARPSARSRHPAPCHPALRRRGAPSGVAVGCGRRALRRRASRRHRASRPPARRRRRTARSSGAGRWAVIDPMLRCRGPVRLDGNEHRHRR